MKIKIITITICVCLALLTIAFKAFETNTKEYVVINYTQKDKQISISSSRGEFTSISAENKKYIDDQSQLLSVIKDYEIKGYKLLEYDYEVAAGNINDRPIVVVLMVK